MKQQKVRLEIAQASRKNVVGVNRTAHLNRIKARYRLGYGVGGLRVLGCFYSGGDYWQ